MTKEATTTEDAVILETINDFVEREVKPYCHDLDYRDEYPHQILEKLRELGLFGAIIDPEYGGAGLSVSTYAKIIEKLAEAWISVAGLVNTHLITAHIIQRFGTEEQKKKWLPKFATGEIRAGIALTEPDAGTDLQAIRTVAVRNGGNYVVNGSKIWITNVKYGNYLALLVKTDPKARPAYRGISLLIAEKGEGMTVSRLEKLGYRGIDTNEIAYDNYHVPIENVLGGVEGQGLNQILAGLELGRINVAARGVGLARAALKESVAYAQTRRTFGKPIGQHQSIAIKIAEMATRLEASAHLVGAAAKAFDEGRKCDMEASMAKLFACETAVFNATEALRIHASYGYSKESNIQRYYRDAPLLVIGEGTSELQRLLVAKAVMERNPV